MNILLSVPDNSIREIYFPAPMIERIKSIGTLLMNPLTRDYTEDELKSAIKDIDICITHWNSPAFTPKVIRKANRLKMIAHAAGSVANLVSSEVYDKGIKVCSSNIIMAKYVAESTLTLMLASLGKVNYFHQIMKDGKWKSGVEEYLNPQSLYRKHIGLIGLGMVGKHLIRLMEPFEVEVKYFDPYVFPEDIDTNLKIEKCEDIDYVVSWSDIVSIHASKTPATYHLVDRGRIGKIKDNALFVNTSRGTIVDEKALIDEAKMGRFNLALDVFESEPLDANSPLRYMNNALLSPHMAGTAGRTEMTDFIINDIERFLNNKSLLGEISAEMRQRMTR